MTPLGLSLLGLGAFLVYVGVTAQSFTDEIRGVVTGQRSDTKTTSPEQRAQVWKEALKGLTAPPLSPEAQSVGAANQSGLAGLAQPFGKQLAALMAAVQRQGGTLTIISGRRTRAQQVELRKKNGCPDIYTAPASACEVPTARPGESKHETGEAADLAGDLAAAHRLMGLYGIGTPVPGEPWHFELVRR